MTSSSGFEFLTEERPRRRRRLRLRAGRYELDESRWMNRRTVLGGRVCAGTLSGAHTRRFILVAGVVVGSVVGADVAQVSGMHFGTSCGNSTTRGRCNVTCNGNACNCGDGSCKMPQYLSLGSSVYMVPAKALRVA
jgi:hypothetical protein